MPNCEAMANAAVLPQTRNGLRSLVVLADDYGIGPATSHAILELGQAGTITAAVLLVTSPFAEEAVSAWHQASRPMELGWHPCLTLDRPVLSPDQVPSLVGQEGTFWPLKQFLWRWALGRLRASEIAAELRAQYVRFVELVGHPPSVVNSHQHVQFFAPIGAALLGILDKQQPLPYLRRVREPWRLLGCIPGARLKRASLTLLAGRQVRRQIALGFPGNDYLAGITDPPCVEDPQYLARWLARIPGQLVELVCHPGYYDETLLGRDCTAAVGLRRRVHELCLLRQPSFQDVCARAGFQRLAPAEVGP